MKKLFKLLVLAAIVAGAVAVYKKKTRQDNGPLAEWIPPSVEPAVATEEAVAEDEGMAAPATDTEEDAPRGSGGEVLVAEFAAPGAAPAVEDAGPGVEEALDVAADEGMTPPPDAPAEDIALSAEGEPVVSDLAAPGAEAALAAAETAIEEELDVAADEGMGPPAHEPAEDLALGSDGTPLISELAALDAETALVEALEASAEAEAEAAAAAAPDFGAMLAEAEEAGAAAEVTGPEAATDQAETKDPDFLTQYFEELAATPEEPETVAAPAAAQPAPAPRDEDLISSVEEALGDLEPAPIVPPPRRTAESYLDEGNVYFNVGQYGLAIERYGQAIELDRDLTAAFYNRANAQTRAGEFEKALADYDRALELQPQDADALNNRGMLHLYRSNFPAALADFNRALEIDPSDTTVMVNRGLAHLHGGNAAAALVDFREAATLDSGDAAAQYGAAQAAASLGNRDEALRHIARALELDLGYAREAAADPRLALLAGDEEFLKLLRQSGSRAT